MSASESITKHEKREVFRAHRNHPDSAIDAVLHYMPPGTNPGRAMTVLTQCWHAAWKATRNTRSFTSGQRDGTAGLAMHRSTAARVFTRALTEKTSMPPNLARAIANTYADAGRLDRAFKQ